VVAAGVGGREGVEDGGEDGDGESRAELRGGGDGLSEIRADSRKEDIGIGRLVNKVDQEVVGRGDLYILKDKVSFSSSNRSWCSKFPTIL